VSIFSDPLEITTAPLCSVDRELAFVQPPINYIISTAQIPFTIPSYTTTGCPSNETIDFYECHCYRNSDNSEWKPTLTALISSSGGIIHETNG
jgi:hypothetical protein